MDIKPYGTGRYSTFKTFKVQSSRRYIKKLSFPLYFYNCKESVKKVSVVKTHNLCIYKINSQIIEMC